MHDNKNHLPLKNNLHPRNKHREAYDFQALRIVLPELGQFVNVNEFGNESIDFFNPKAVKALNYALLKYFYKIENWEIPTNYLCPPIPGRADYIHYIADIIGPQKTKINCLDIGIGSNCIYPIIGVSEYDWNFVGSDIDPISIKNAQQIIASNSILKVVKIVKLLRMHFRSMAWILILFHGFCLRSDHSKSNFENMEAL